MSCSDWCKTDPLGPWERAQKLNKTTTFPTVTVLAPKLPN